MSSAIRIVAERAPGSGGLGPLRCSQAERPADERFAHLVFAGECSPPTGSPRPPARRQASPARSELVLDPESADFYAWLCRSGGLDVGSYRASVLQRRLAACLRALRASSVGQARALIEREPARLDAALGALLIGVTDFFRDEAVFAALEPRLRELDEGAPRATGLRVLSLACSIGQELYSVAMLLAEQGLLAGPGQLVGIDALVRAVETARTGIYPSSAAEPLGGERRRRWLEPSGGGVRVVDELRAACRFEVGDALAAPDAVQVDLLLCRNLAIYLEAEAAQKLWASIAARLRPGGLLVTGKAERPDSGDFEPLAPCLFRRA